VSLEIEIIGSNKSSGGVAGQQEMSWQNKAATQGIRK